MIDVRTGAGTLRTEHVDGKVTLSGWVHKRRDFGELIFIDLRDRTGVCQLVFDQDRLASGELLTSAKELRSEFVITVEGVVANRIENQKNAAMATGDVEVLVSNLVLLSRSETPPFTVDDETTASEDLRLKYRYLDLRRPALASNFVLRDRVSYKVREYLHRTGFLEIETPILTKSTPEGARDYLVPSRIQNGSFYALPQSPQLFKQLLMVAGLDRYYQIARCFRDEDLRSDRQPEFTQIDIEASFINEEFIFELIEGLFAEIFPLANIDAPTPFPRMTWREAMDRYGIDRPDTRFGLELLDLSAAVQPIEFAPFKAAVEGQGKVKGILIPGKSSFSRKRIDELTEYVKLFGASGLIWIKFDAEVTTSIKKFVTDDDLDRLKEVSGASQGDLLLIVAGKEQVVSDALANLRLKVAREESMIPENKWNFLWVVDFPLLGYDEKGGRYMALHHPFTSPALDEVDKIESDPGNVKARAYDVILNGMELGGGSIRINQPELQSRMFRALGISDEEAQERFGFLLDAFRFGAPPHGGIALGLDRMIMLMARSRSIRDVIAFPKTTRGQDLMTDAPSSVSSDQLQELGLILQDAKE